MQAETDARYTLCAVKGAPKGHPKPRRKRVWHLSPEGFRELRHSCFLSPKACAEFLGVSLRTVRHWDAGRNRVPWSVVRLLRLCRLGDLGALNDQWSGWTLNRNGLWSPEGRGFHTAAMRHWYLTIEHARLWREAYDRGEIRGVGRSPAQTLQPAAGVAAKQAAAAQHGPTEAATTLTAVAHDAAQGGVGTAVSLCIGAVRAKSAAAARSDAGLVISSTSGTRFARRHMLQGFPRIAHGR